MGPQLPPGSIVSENEISAALNLSRTPIREALIELSRSKLVEILPQKGSYVTRIDLDLAEESRFLRCVVETAVFRQAAEQQILEGKPADTVAQLMKQHKNDDPRQKLEKEKNRLEKTITALQQRLQYVEESLENL